LKNKLENFASSADINFLNKNKHSSPVFPYLVFENTHCFKELPNGWESSDEVLLMPKKKLVTILRVDEDFYYDFPLGHDLNEYSIRFNMIKEKMLKLYSWASALELVTD
jgi:hypothetical protein